MDRRVFLGTVAAGVLAAAGALAAGASVGGRFPGPSGPPASPPSSPLPALPSALPRPAPGLQAAPIPLPRYFRPPELTRVRVPHGTITALPGKGNLIALTVDDGVSTEVVSLYTQFARKTGMRITFFLNGARPSWTDNAAALRPLVESGQVQLA
ncbi:MAG: hypothetical protein ACYCZY_08835, partial [Lacisediminihabitans sp.]